jgi:peptidoglycan/xylan/chitin deacetylase (PgdA/CDA1 family)
MTPGRGVLYVASATGLALLARSLLLAPLPLWIALLAFASYGAIVLAGVLLPQLEMYGPVVWRGPRGSASVALTFDDGPHPEHTLRVLDILDDYGVKATFFVLGSKADKHPQIIAEIAQRGHEIGVHGYDHDRFSSLRTAARIEADVARAIAVVERITGVRPTLYRPPVGHVSPRTDTAASRLDLDIVAWSVRGRDGVEGARPAQVAARVIRGLKPGAIVLLHDAAEHDDRVPASIEALPAILRAAASQGLSFTPAGEFVRQRFGDGS